MRLIVISVAAFIFLLLFDPYSPSLSFVVMGTTAYVAFMASPWGLTLRQREEIAAKDRRVGVAAGLADALFAFVENSYAGPLAQEAREKYIEENQLEFKRTGKPYCNTDFIWPPLILFPDLTSDYYKDIFENEEKSALVSELVDVEYEERRAKGSEDQSVFKCPTFHYDYEVGSEKRNSHYDVIRYEERHPQTNTAKMSYYFSVLDNRPLNCMKKVGLANNCEVILSREDFAKEVEKMKTRLLELMAAKRTSDSKFPEERIISVKGRLSDVLRDLVKSQVTKGRSKAKDE